ncbi:MAG: hypothetical protein JWN52_3012, partial [Actinomycetia bacterium]|nr:hypothetical protein [Actinomycetes bacterium]
TVWFLCWQPRSHHVMVASDTNVASVDHECLWTTGLCANYLYVFKAARDGPHGPPTRRLPGAPTDVRRQDRQAAGRLARTRIGTAATPKGHRTAAGPERPAVPLAGSRLARGPRAGPHDGQFRAGCEQPVRQPRLRGPAPAQVRNRPAPTCTRSRVNGQPRPKKRRRTSYGQVLFITRGNRLRACGIDGNGQGRRGKFAATRRSEAAADRHSARWHLGSRAHSGHMAT